MKKKDQFNYNYAFLFYDVGEKRVNKVFKICKKYFKHHQKSVFRGHIRPADIIALRNELRRVIDEEYDSISIIKFISVNDFDEETLGKESDSESIFI